MIKVVMTKTSEDYWYRIKTIQNLEELITILKNERRLVLQTNWNYKSDPKKLADRWDGMTLEDAKEVSECEFIVEIYDSYRE